MVLSTFAALFIPLCWILASVACRSMIGANLQRLHRITNIASLMALAGAIAAVAALVTSGPATIAVAGWPSWVPSLRIDAVSVTMVAIVTIVGVVVVRYSLAYLAGDEGQRRFFAYLSETLAAVLLLVLAGNLLVFLAAWVLMSLSLHRLLEFYPERPRALLAARKKFVAARASDIVLLMAVLQLAHTTGTWEIAALASAAAALPAEAMTAPALLLALAALLKSAQFPLHSWLTEVMESPTPVSALLHAGIVNAGGFLLVRFSDVLVISPVSMYLLLIVGGITAIFGSLVMLTQRSIKGALAYSTIAQMGFMVLQCGLGAFSSAMLHIAADSLYKAHAFLASGSIVDVARGAGFRDGDEVPGPVIVTVSAVLTGAVVVGWGVVFGATVASKPAILGLGAVLAFGALHLVIQSSLGQSKVVQAFRAFLTANVVAFLYFLFQLGAAWVFADAVPASGSLDVVQQALMVLMLVSFGAVTLLQWYLPVLQKQPRWQALWVHLSNGFYLNQMLNQIMAAPRRGARDSQ